MKPTSCAVRARFGQMSGLAVGCALLLGCAHGGRPAPSDPIDAARARYLWVKTDCIDGAVDLARVGYSGEVVLEHDSSGPLITFCSALERGQCTETSVVRGHANDHGLYRFLTVPAVVMPAGAACVPGEPLGHRGSLEITGDRARVVVHNAAVCRGLDAHSDYVRVKERALTDEERIVRFAALYNLRDGRALSELFAPDAVVTEPFSRTDDDGAKRHVGREAIRKYFDAAFKASQWSAMRVLGIRSVPERSGYQMDFEYMDSGLAEPFSGRSLFVFGGSSIYWLDLQVTGEIRPGASAVVDNKTSK